MQPSENKVFIIIIYTAREMLWFRLFPPKEREDLEFSGNPGPLTFRAMKKNP